VQSEGDRLVRREVVLLVSAKSRSTRSGGGEQGGRSFAAPRLRVADAVDRLRLGEHVVEQFPSMYGSNSFAFGASTRKCLR